ACGLGLAVVCGGCGAQPRATAPPARLASTSDRIDVAITVDDLPRNGPDIPGVTRLAVHERMLAAFARHRTPPVYGFVNGKALEEHPEERAALDAWRSAGFPLGNHGYAHAHAGDLSVAAFLSDLDRNERVLGELAGPDAAARASKVFRFPFLEEGADVPSRARLRAELAERGYRIAEATIDFFDWAYAPPYARCLEQGDARAVDALKETYLYQAAGALLWADEAARGLFGRPIKQILLLHDNAFTALVADELLTTYEKRGARFVSLDEALSDPAYAEEPRVPKDCCGHFFMQVRASRGTRSPAFPPQPDTLLDLVCRR
ncbi:MAG TPA: polysaccharide deacetylase family protein, partial [Polyangiaceae bacterium]|nr:polysaccharide deacetylase family protein [Polyangiaceae bacterium]